MKLHIHRWKYYSSKHRICRGCGEPQAKHHFVRGIYTMNPVSGWYWEIQNLDEWKAGIPVAIRNDFDEKKKVLDEKANELIRKFKEEVGKAEIRKEGQEFLKTVVEGDKNQKC